MGLVIQKTPKKTTFKVGKIEYKLPDKPSTPLQTLGGYTMLLYGEKKIGKTTLCAEFPGALFLMFEPGGKALRIFQEPMNSWLKFTRFVDLIIKDEKFKTIVIDTVDFAYDDCLICECKKLGIEHPSDAGWGKGWASVKSEFSRQIRKLLRSGKGVIFISHQREVEIETRSGKKFHRKTNTMTGQGKETIEGLIDIWANYDYVGEGRYLTVLGDDYIDAGNRCKENFKYTDGIKIRKIYMGNSPKEAYTNFINAFNNKLINKEKGG